MPPMSMPPASIWEKYPEVSIIILVSLVFVGLFILYNERREKMWMKFLDEQRVASSVALKEQRDQDRDVLEKLVSRIEGLGEKMDAHDNRMNSAITRMDERTRPRRKGGEG